MGFKDILLNIGLNVPWEDVFIPARNKATALERFVATLPAAGARGTLAGAKEASTTATGPPAASLAPASASSATQPPAPSQNPPQIGSESLPAASAPALPTTEETIQVLQKDLAKELYRFQLDLARGCKIAGKPCDCCEKHPIFGVESLVEELIPMDPANPVYPALTQWIKDSAPKLTLEASASGKYDAEYPRLAADVRAFRKDLLGTEALSAMRAVPQAMPPEGGNPGDVYQYGPPAGGSSWKLVGPTERRELPQELDFVADSLEHVGESINRNGLRSQLDSAFTEALSRVRK